ncbi:MAG: efflux RND transporter periplasmic adaptor subunit [Acidobacteriota bacterium]|nr:efflux RND transporter periplasmic adaptor subunit [Acidobacteriota bacterium]
MTRSTGMLIMPVILPLVLTACGTNSTATVESSVGQEVAATPVRTLELGTEAITDIAILSADLLPRRRATLAAEVAGTIEALGVDIGDRVARGQSVCRIDTRTLRQQVAEAEALYTQALDRWERADKLFAKRSITKEKHIDARASRDVADARLASARLALAKSDVKAPWAGRVAARLAEVGDYAAPGQPLLELVAVDRLKVRAAASSTDVPYLAIGAPVRLTVDVLPGEVFTGSVIRLGAELDPDTRTLDVEAEIDNSDDRLRPGFFGRLEVPRRTISDALLIPLSAVVDFEDHKVAYVVEDGSAVRQEITLGTVIGERVVVTGGIIAGQRVIISGLQQVADGQPVVEETL